MEAMNRPALEKLTAAKDGVLRARFYQPATNSSSSRWSGPRSQLSQVSIIALTRRLASIDETKYMSSHRFARVESRSIIG